MLLCYVAGCTPVARRSPVTPAEPHSMPSPSIQTGIASWYGPGFQGQPTASGERFQPQALTAAHRTLPLGSRVTVTNLANGRSVRVRINDRGPYVRGRAIDLSRGAARQLGLENRGLGRVRIAVDFRSGTRRRSTVRVVAKPRGGQRRQLVHAPSGQSPSFGSVLSNLWPF
jgi:rare lipoprotein A